MGRAPFFGGALSLSLSLSLSLLLARSHALTHARTHARTHSRTHARIHRLGSRPSGTNVAVCACALARIINISPCSALHYVLIASNNIWVVGLGEEWRGSEGPLGPRPVSFGKITASPPANLHRGKSCSFKAEWQSNPRRKIFREATFFFQTLCKWTRGNFYCESSEIYEAKVQRLSLKRPSGHKTSSTFLFVFYTKSKQQKVKTSEAHSSTINHFH